MPSGLDGARDRVVSTARDAVLADVGAAVLDLPPAPNVLVAVDGASATGKSTFADELAEVLVVAGRPVVRASVDSFHRPRRARHRRGRSSPEGYDRDSHDLERLEHGLLVPFRTGRGGYVTAVFDEPSDAPVEVEVVPAPAGAVLVFDGLFLQRPELAAFWDLVVLLTADRRREELFAAYPERALARRYVEGQRWYEAEARPFDRADVVLDNDDLTRPRRLR